MGMASPHKKKGSGSAIMAEINITPLTFRFAGEAVNVRALRERLKRIQ